MKKIIQLSLGVAALFLLAGCVDSNSESDRARQLKNVPSAGAIEIVKNNFDFGDIDIFGGKVETNFIFKNTGDEPVVLTQGTTSCMCTEGIVRSTDGAVSPRLTMHAPARINQVLDPGEEAMLTAIFDPLAHGPNAVGSIMRELIVKTNSQKTPEIIFKFQGKVVKNK